MLVFTIANLKGGVGKSTLAQNIGCMLHRSGHRTVILDADVNPDKPQASTSHWAAIAAQRGVDIPVVARVNEATEVRREVERMRNLCDALVIDCPPELGRVSRGAMLAADVVVLPVGTKGPEDFWAFQDTLRILAEARDIRPEIKAGAVLNLIKRNTVLARMVTDQVTATGISLLGEITDRTEIGEAKLYGQAVVDYKPRGPAAKELRAVIASALDLLKAEGDRVQEAAG
jgi:chromosome partitioning protein